MANNVVGSVQYDASINLPSLKASLAQADKLVAKSYSDQTKNAQKASNDITKTTQKDAQSRVNAVTQEAQATAASISKYSPQIQRQFLAVERANNTVVNATTRAQTAIQRFGADSVQATKATSSLSVAVQNQSQAQSKLQSMLDGSSGGTGRFSAAMTRAGIVAGSVAAIATNVLSRAINIVTDSVGSAISRFDTLRNAPKVIANLGFSAEDSAKATKLLDKGIRGLPTSLDSATSALVAIASASGKSIQYATDLTLAFNNMALAGGKGPAEAQRALTQYTQALGRGKFQMQDFNTLAEVMPAQLNQVAKSLLGAKANTRTLGTALSEGKLTIDQFNNEIIKLNKEGGSNFASFETQAKDATKGIGTSFTNMQTAITRGVTYIIEAIGSENITNTINGFGKMVENALKGGVDSIKELVKSAKTDGSTLNTALNGTKDSISGINTQLEALKANLDENANSTSALSSALKTIAAVIGFTLYGAIQVIIYAIQGVIAILSSLVDQFNLVVSGLSSVIAFFIIKLDEARTNVSKLFNWISSQSGSLWQTIKNIFVGIGSAIGTAVGDAFKSAVNGILGFLEGRVNFIIDIVNGAIGAIDKITPGNLPRINRVSIPRFADGGFTGRGNKYDPAGIVHKGEYVIPKEQVDQSTGLPKQDAVRTSVIVNLNMNGVMTSSKADERAIANRMAKLINETVTAKTGAPAIQGI